MYVEMFFLASRLNTLIFLCSDGAIDQFVLVTQNKSWYEAQSYCRQHYTDLVSVRSAEENQLLRNQLQDAQMKEAWIGLHRDSWKWSDSSETSFRRWGPNEPNNENNAQMCAAMHKGIWTDRNCDTQFSFLCQSKEQYCTF